MDTIRNKAAILALLADNDTGNISAQDMRDVVITMYHDMEATGVLGPYLYIAYALDSAGTGFTTTLNSAYNYIAFLNSPTEILTLTQSNFNGLWSKYKNNTGTGSSQTLQQVTTNGNSSTNSIFLKGATDGLNKVFLRPIDNGSGLIIVYNAAGVATTTINGATGIISNSFSKTGGLSTQFLKADGTIDSNTYQTALINGLADILAVNTSTGDLDITSVSGNSFVSINNNEASLAFVISFGNQNLITASESNLANSRYIQNSSFANTLKHNVKNVLDAPITKLTQGTPSKLLRLNASNEIVASSYDDNNLITTITSAGGDLSGSYPNPIVLNSAILGKLLTGLNITGSSLSNTDTLLQAFGKLQNQINGVLGGAIYHGTYNATTNTPLLADGTGTQGWYYVVSIAGLYNFGSGNIDLNIGDWIIYNGTIWQKVDNTDAVTSVNGFIGAVNLTTSNIGEVTNLYFTNTRAIAALSGQSNTLFTNGAGYITANQNITLSGDVTGSGNTAISTSISNTTVTGKILTGYVSGAGIISATDSILTSIQKLNGNIGAIVSGVSSVNGLTGVVPLTGTTNRLTITASNVFDISSNYIGQASINTLGTITTGVWNGTAIANVNLANSIITIGTTTLSLGSSQTIFIGLSSVTSTSFIGALTGNSTTATTLQNARTINGVSFDGSSNITLTAAASTLTGTTLNSSIISSSLTSVGTITTGIWNGTAITNANLANSTITIGTTTLSLGSSSTTLVGLTSVTSIVFIGSLTGNSTTSTTLQTARTISGTGEATFTTTAFDGSAAVSGVITLSNSAVINKVLTGYVSGTGTITSTDSILSAIQKLNGNVALVSGAVVYAGLWNASTNTPTLTSGVGTKGTMYKVSVAGTTLVDGITQWNINDQIVFNGTTWDKLDGASNEVLSVNGATGIVTLSVTPNQGITGTYTGTSLTISLGVLTGVTSFNGLIITANTGIITTGTWNGTAIIDMYISSASTWNAKQNALSGTGFVKSTAGVISYDTSVYLTANQNITLSGDATGSGTTSIVVTLNNSSVTGQVLTGYTSGAGTISATDSILTSIQKLNGNIGAIVSGVSSVFGRTGAVISVSGDYTTTLVTEGINLYYTQSRFDTAFGGKNTTNLTEGVNLYFTNSRAINSLLTGYISGTGTISATDSILGAIQKLNGNINALVTGVSSVNGLVGAVALTGTTNRLTISAANVFDISANYIGQSSITTLGTITTGVWNGTSIVDTYISSASTWNAKQNALSGTGFVKSTAGVISYDTNTYLTANQTITLTGDVTGSGSTSIATSISNATITAKLLTGYISGAGTISATDSILSSIQKLNGNISALVTGVSSVFGRTGAVVAISGDYTTTLITEGTNLYFTNSRAINSLLTGYISGSGTISVTDSILSSIQKLNGNIGALVTGVSSVNGLTGSVSLTGTLNRLTISAANVFDISANYIGQSSITTLGTITTGIWNGASIIDTYISSATNWNIAYTNRIISLTTTGNSGSSTLLSNVLNIPTYTLAGLGGQPLNTNLTSLSSLTYVSGSFVKMTAAGTFSLDTNVYLTTNQTITLSGDVTGSGNISIVASISNVTVTGKLLTGYVSGAGVISVTDNILSAIQKLNGNINALVTGVSSVFGRTGAVIAVSGDYTTTLVTEGTNLYYTQSRFDTAFGAKSTTNLSEGINLYFTNARTIASALTGYLSGAGTVSATDSILTSIQKLNGNIAALVTGVSSVNGLTGSVALTGTLNRLTVSIANVFDISANYIGQSSITTLGTITTGVWNGASIIDTYISSAVNWNTAYSNRITSLTTTGNSGASTLVSNVLNIPTYTLVGLNGQPLNTNLTSISTLSYVSGSFLKMTAAGTFSLDINIYLTANQNITLSGDVTGSGATSIVTSISNVTVTGKLLTGYISGAGTISATDSILTSIQKLNGNVSALVTGVSSVFGRTGSVVAASGDYTTTLVTEGTNLYFTNARVDSRVQSYTGDITLTGAVFAIGTSKVTNTMLVNSSVTIGTTTISLGLSSTTLAGLTSVSSTLFTGALTGNATTSTSLQTARTINGVSFDGTINITVTAAASTLTGTTLNATVVSSSLTSVGTLTNGSTGLGFTVALGTSTITGILASTNGGTGFNTYVAGDIIYASALNTLSKLAIGTTGQVLKIVAGLPTWSTDAIGTGTVTSVSVTTANGISGTVATSTTTPAITLTLGAITPTSVNGNTFTTGAGTLNLSTFTLTVAGTSSINGTFSGNSSNTNTGDQTITLTGDLTGSGTGSFVTTLATVNSNIGTFGSASKTLTVTTNAKGLTTAIIEQNIQIAESQVTGLITDLSAKEAIINKDSTGGYVGLTLFKINFKNNLNTFTSYFTNSNTASRTYTFLDADMIVVGDTTTQTLTNKTLVTPIIGSITGIAGVNGLTIITNNTASVAIARGLNLTPTLIAAANSDVLVGLDINPTFTNGAFTGVKNIGLRVNSGQILAPDTILGYSFTTSQNSGLRYQSGAVSIDVNGLTCFYVNGSGFRFGSGSNFADIVTGNAWFKFLSGNAIGNDPNNNSFLFTNAPTTVAPMLGVTGTDTNINFSINAKGIGRVLLNNGVTSTTTITAISALAQAFVITPTLIAAANSDVLVGLDINPTFTNGVFTSVINLAARIGGNLAVVGNIYAGNGTTTPTAFIDISASTALQASLRLRTGVAPTSPNTGDTYQDGTHCYMFLNSTWKMLDTIVYATVNTIDATLTTLQTIAIPTNSAILIEYRINSIKTSGAGTGTIGDTNSYIRVVKVKNVGGVVTLGTISSSYTSADIKAFLVTHSVSGTNVIIQVTGATNDNVTWTTSSIITQ